MRQGLIALFTTELGILVVGDSGDGLETVDLIRAKKPDVILLNTRMPKLNGLGVARRIRKFTKPPELVFLTNLHTESQMREAFSLGARSYLLQDCDFKELVFSVRKAAVGDFYLSGPAGRNMVDEYINPTNAEEGSTGGMTRRELELAKLLADGYSSKEAADYMNISIKTAEAHRAAIMKKLHAKNVTDIVKFCIRNNIVSP
ncbi:MAG: response regulator transcription factor [candidate division Zixibacteria bacterium]|nr:response regulator transcription factor [candidate division Zixibacteria bacterium]